MLSRTATCRALLGDPDVLVLDEPTAGLDPGYEKVVLTTLRSLADAGRTVIVVSHSLDALRACDRAVFLTAGGSVGFVGTPAQAKRYFKQADAADVFLALDVAPHLWRQEFAASSFWLSSDRVLPAEDNQKLRVRTKTGPATSWRQLAMLLARFVDLLRGDRRHLAVLAARVDGGRVAVGGAAGAGAGTAVRRHLQLEDRHRRAVHRVERHLARRVQRD